jgi:H+-translocating NAD(P) transhydrogenase subunit beta
MAAVGMVIAIIGTIFLYQDAGGKHLGNKGLIFAALVVGTVVGVLAAKKVKMTAMPEMVSLFNGMGGACAMLISIIEFNQQKLLTEADANVHIHKGEILIITLGLIIGSVSFAGSVIAWGKLNGRVKDKVFPGQRIINFFLLACIAITAAYFVYVTPSETGITNMQAYTLYGILTLSLLYGVFFVMPIGGADMPVVISLLNSFTGVAAACGGFMYDNKAMLTGGILVGAAGTLLTILMCKAMNRSLLNVIVGAFGANATSNKLGGNTEQGSYKEISLSDSAMVMSYANKVMIVPGYGLAVAQAQHICHELEKILADKGVEVKYAIHPVAGRMPGHMNVLLAEADVSYEKLLEMEQANDEFKTTDVVLILGANDVVNPAAKKDPASPIYGMPILEVELAKNVIVNKRSMKPGYAGIENDLFFQPKTSMLFGDAKKVLQDLVAEIKNS